jgi:hypothetical protein
MQVIFIYFGHINTVFRHKLYQKFLLILVGATVKMSYIRYLNFCELYGCSVAQTLSRVHKKWVGYIFSALADEIGPISIQNASLISDRNSGIYTH